MLKINIENLNADRYDDETGAAMKTGVQVLRRKERWH